MPPPCGVGGRAKRQQKIGVWLALGLLGVAAAAGLVLAWQGYLAPPWGEVVGRVDSGCRLDRSSCAAVYPDAGELRVTMARTSVSPSAPVRLRMVFRGLSPRSVVVDLNGETMNMGPNEVVLRLGSDGVWEGETTLTACITGAMTWVASVRAEAGAGAWTARFLFDTGS